MMNCRICQSCYSQLKERLYLVKLVESLPELGGEKLLHGLGHELHDLEVETCPPSRPGVTRL